MGTAAEDEKEQESELTLSLLHRAHGGSFGLSMSPCYEKIEAKKRENRSATISPLPSFDSVRSSSDSRDRTWLQRERRESISIRVHLELTNKCALTFPGAAMSTLE